MKIKFQEELEEGSPVSVPYAGVITSLIGIINIYFMDLEEIIL